MSKPYISVVVPVYNEAENLENLYSRLAQVLNAYGKPHEIIMVNDGSSDNSEMLLDALQQKHPECLKVIHFNGNFGQHMAIMAGFEHASGEIAVTLDADLQNPPEEIPKLIQAIEAGHDYVGSVRKNRQDSWFRRNASKLNNFIRARITGIVMNDQGCMLRAYRRSVVDAMLSSKESVIYIPALAYTYSSNPIEVEIEHSPRAAGTSKYNFYKLLLLNFDIMTGFSLVPLQVFTFIGIASSLLSGLFVFFLLIRRLILGPEVEGIFTLFAILYFLISIVLMGLGIIGEYLGRIHQEVKKRPRYIVRKIAEKDH